MVLGNVAGRHGDIFLSDYTMGLLLGYIFVSLGCVCLTAIGLHLNWCTDREDKGGDRMSFLDYLTVLVLVERRFLLVTRRVMVIL